jgi:hypothetical protein
MCYDFGYQYWFCLGLCGLPTARPFCWQSCASPPILNSPTPLPDALVDPCLDLGRRPSDGFATERHRSGKRPTLNAVINCASAETDYFLKLL